MNMLATALKMDQEVSPQGMSTLSSTRRWKRQTQDEILNLMSYKILDAASLSVLVV